MWSPESSHYPSMGDGDWRADACEGQMGAVFAAFMKQLGVSHMVDFAVSKCVRAVSTEYQGQCVPRADQTYCDRLVQDTPFLTGQGRLSEQQVDRIILQLNRYYPQILTNKEAEKFRNPKASLRVRLCDLLSHLQRSGERHCQEFYRALYIHAQPLHSCLPSRHTLQNSDCTELGWGSESRELSDRGPMSFLAGLGLAAGLALLLYCCPPDPKVLPGARRLLGFSPIIVDRHVSRYLLAFLADDLGGL